MSVFVHPSSIVHESAILGEGTKVWQFCHIMQQAQIGKDCSFGQNVMVGPGVRIGNNCKVQNNVSIYEGVECDDDVFMGPSMVFTNVINPRSAVNRKSEFKPTRVGRGATIGANATIVCGTKLGQYCFIGAGAVVTKDVPDFALVYGTPARQFGWMSRFGQRLNFDSSGQAQCPESGEYYTLNSQGVVNLTPNQP